MATIWGQGCGKQCGLIVPLDSATQACGCRYPVRKCGGDSVSRVLPKATGSAGSLEIVAMALFVLQDKLY